MNMSVAIKPAAGSSALLLGMTGLILLGAPLAGVWLAGQPLAGYLELPPRPPARPASGFSWTAFILLVLFTVAAVSPLIWRFLSTPAPGSAQARPGGAFPVWGGAALAWLAASWVLAWTRFPWFEVFQLHTFTPLWLGYIGVVNALTTQRVGSCLMIRQPSRFAALFPLSALFWWFFEYLNRFVANWRYTGISDFDAMEYTFFATLAFSTVLPAVTSTAEWLGTFPRMDAAFRQWHPVLISRPRPVAAGVLVVTTVSLCALGLFSEYVFPLVWISPVLVIVCLLALSGRPTVLAPLARGDWRFFWEMWNFGSLARWEYSIPHVDRFRIFEMPLLGYAGYLPFGIECAAIAALVLKRNASP
jgi:hypothetical protein